MKAITLFLAALFLFSFNENKTQYMDIFDAIESNQIIFSAKSNGGHSSESIVVAIENIGKISSVIIPAGTRFVSESEGDQDLLTTEDEFIALKPGKTELKLNGYCVQKSHSSPEENSNFTLIKEDIEQLVELAKYLNQKEIASSVKQTAIWCVTDNADVSGIYEENNEEVSELRDYVCNLTGIENVWYNTDPTYSVDVNRNIIHAITKVEGHLSYTVTKTGNLAMEICNEEGEIIRTFGGTSRITHLGDFNFNFSLAVQGWESGSYSVHVKIGSDEIHRTSFQIG